MDYSLLKATFQALFEGMSQERKDIINSNLTTTMSRGRQYSWHPEVSQELQEAAETASQVFKILNE